MPIYHQIASYIYSCFRVDQGRITKEFALLPWIIRHSAGLNITDKNMHQIILDLIPSLIMCAWFTRLSVGGFPRIRVAIRFL